jgi:hypothetical protein
MNIPTYVRRRISEIDSYLTHHLIRYPFPIVKQNKEEYLHMISCGTTGWFIQTYDYRSVGLPADYHKKVNGLIPVIKYLIRIKVIVHWEKMNEVKE